MALGSGKIRLSVKQTGEGCGSLAYGRSGRRPGVPRLRRLWQDHAATTQGTTLVVAFQSGEAGAPDLPNVVFCGSPARRE